MHNESKLTELSSLCCVECLLNKTNRRGSPLLAVIRRVSIKADLNCSPAHSLISKRLKDMSIDHTDKVPIAFPKWQIRAIHFGNLETTHSAGTDSNVSWCQRCFDCQNLYVCLEKVLVSLIPDRRQYFEPDRKVSFGVVSEDRVVEVPEVL